MLPDEGPPSHDRAAAPDVPRMPWEDRGRGAWGRLLDTLGSGLHPVRDVARVSHGPVGASATFALWTAVPLMFLAGIFPFTQLLLFGSSTELQLAGEPTTGALFVDVLRGGALGVAHLSVTWLVASWNFVALARFSSDPQLTPARPAPAAWRVALYRAWLLPAGLTFFYLIAWLGPEPNETRAQLLMLVSHALPSVILMLHFSAVARYLGASPLAAAPVSLLPVLVFWPAYWWGLSLLMELGLLPVPEMPAS